MSADAAADRPRGRRWAAAAGLAAGLGVLIASVALGAPVPTNPEPDLECPDAFGAGLVTRYVTTVNTPADSADWWVSVEVTIENETGANASCELSLASYELPGPDFVFPQTLFDSATGTLGAGTHTLTVQLPREGDLPGCFSQYDFVFGPAIENLTFEDRYGDRQIRSRIVGGECAEQETPTPTPTPTPSPTPTPTPEQQQQGGTPTPTPEQQAEGSVPDTSMTGTGGSGIPLILGLVLVLALGSMGYVNLRAVVKARNR
jgi:hypothetical protein